MLEFYQKHFMNDIKLINQINFMLWFGVTIGTTVAMFYDWIRSPLMFVILILLWSRVILTIACFIKFKNKNDVK